VFNVGTNVTGVAVLMHHVSKIGGTFKTSAVLVLQVLDFKLPVPTVLVAGKTLALDQETQENLLALVEF
jgi:hypothetical protein